MDQPVVRPASKDDLEALLGTIRTGNNVHYYDLEVLIRSADAYAIIAEIEGRIVASGYTRIERSEPYLTHAKHSYLGFMFVMPEYRGRGINKPLLSGGRVYET